MPATTIIALLVNPTNPNAETLPRELQEAARTLGLRLHVVRANNERDFDMVFESLDRVGAGALIVGTDAFLGSRSDQLAALALRHSMPATNQGRFTAFGGLMSYGASISDLGRRAGIYAGRILKGGKGGRSSGRPIH